MRNYQQGVREWAVRAQRDVEPQKVIEEFTIDLPTGAKGKMQLTLEMSVSAFYVRTYSLVDGHPVQIDSTAYKTSAEASAAFVERRRSLATWLAEQVFDADHS